MVSKMLTTGQKCKVGGVIIRAAVHIQWNLTIMNLLGAMRKVCCSEVFVIIRSILIEIYI